MASLTIKTGTKHEVKKGLVELEGPCVVLREIGKNLEERMVFAYHLNPGETVRREDGDDYIVEY
jgi:hypothetical protein